MNLLQMTISRRARYRGALLGLATGDALGTTLEFAPAGSFEPIEDMNGGGPFDLTPGQWTDDTSLALCLAESLIERQGFDPVDQMRRYLRWNNEGYMSSTGECFDIGGTTRRALELFEQTGNPFSGLTDPLTAGNGSLMRLAPVPLAFAANPRNAIFHAAESSKTTHGTREAIDACRYFAALLIGALAGEDKETLLADHYTPVPGYWTEEPLTEKIDAIASGSFKHREPPDIVGSGYVVRSLEAALWAFHRSSDFREGCLMAANLGDDADTTTAICGQIAGAYYGEEGIPEAWKSKLAKHDLIVEFADSLIDLSTTDIRVSGWQAQL